MKKGHSSLVLFKNFYKKNSKHLLSRTLFIDCFRYKERIHAFFYKQRFFSTQPQCCLTFLWIELQMLLRCCLIQTSIIILRNFLYLPYLCLCLDLGLFFVVPKFTSYIRDLFFIFIFIFNTINSIVSVIQTYLFFFLFLEYVLLFLDDNVNKECK